MRIRLFAGAALAATLLLAPSAWGQNNCQTFRAVIQANWIDVAVASPLLPILQSSWTGTQIPLPPSGVYGWQGPFVGTLDGKVVFGYYSPLPSTTPPSQSGVVGKEGKPISKLDFGLDGAVVTVADSKGIFPIAPGHAGFGSYSETGKIDSTQGTGKFQNAFGNVSYSGPWIAYPTTSDPSPTAPGSGIWHAEINGRICNIVQ